MLRITVAALGRRLLFFRAVFGVPGDPFVDMCSTCD
jgi:hypothetical protein